MKKIEFIWREILTTALEKRQTRFSQKELAEKFRLSTSTVFHALKKPRATGAVKINGRGFELLNFEKLLFLWATERNLKNEIIYQTLANLPIMEIEGSMPPGVIPTAYTAYRFLFKDAPADYDKVYFYSDDLTSIKERFPPNKKEPNIFILKPDSYLKIYRPCPPLPQIFVDLWNLSHWYAKDYQEALLEKINERLGL